MAFTRIDNNDLNTIELLNDQPNQRGGLTAQQLKEKFDANAQTIADFINDVLLGELEGNGAISGYSGAKNVGVSSRADFSTYTNVEDVLIYFRDLIRQAVAGQLGDNDVKTNMLDHANGSEAVDTGAIRNGAVTNDKIATGVNFTKIVGNVPTNRLDGTITNEQLAGSISYDKLAGSIRNSQLYGDISADKLVSGFNVTTFAEKLSGALPIVKGGTGATTASGARTNISVTEQGKLKVGSTEYTLRTGSSGEAGYITFVL